MWRRGGGPGGRETPLAGRTASGGRRLGGAAVRREERRRRVRRGVFGGGQLAAGAVDLAATGVADRHRDAVGLQTPDEGPLVLRAGCRPLRARSRVERNQVAVHELFLDEPAEQVGPPLLVVD